MPRASYLSLSLFVVGTVPATIAVCGLAHSVHFRRNGLVLTPPVEAQGQCRHVRWVDSGPFPVLCPLVCHILCDFPLTACAAVFFLHRATCSRHWSHFSTSSLHRYGCGIDGAGGYDFLSNHPLWPHCALYDRRATAAAWRNDSDGLSPRVAATTATEVFDRCFRMVRDSFVADAVEASSVAATGSRSLQWTALRVHSKC